MSGTMTQGNGAGLPVGTVCFSVPVVTTASQEFLVADHTAPIPILYTFRTVPNGANTDFVNLVLVPFNTVLSFDGITLRKP